MSPADRVETQVIESLAGLAALAREWDALARSAELPMLTHAWVQTAAATLYREDQLHVLVIRRQGALAAVAPLVTGRRAGIRRLGLIGGSHFGEPSDLLFESNAAQATLARAVADAGLPFVLARIPATSPFVAAMKAAAHGPLSVVPAAGTLSVPIACTWDEYAASLSQQRRYDLRRARRRAEEAGKVTIRIFDPRPDQLDEPMAELVRIESAGWKERRGSSLSRRDGLREFFRRYALDAARAGNLRFSFLDVDGRAIAAQLSVLHRGRLWVLKIGYDEAWSRCSPGLQLLAETMRHAFEQRLSSYEFLGSDEPWLHGWPGDRRECVTIKAYPANLAGAWSLAADAIAGAAGRAAAIIGARRGGASSVR